MNFSVSGNVFRPVIPRNSTLARSVYEKEEKNSPEAKSTDINLSYKWIKYILNLVSTSANGSPGSRRATLLSSVLLLMQNETWFMWGEKKRNV